MRQKWPLKDSNCVQNFKGPTDIFWTSQWLINTPKVKISLKYFKPTVYVLDFKCHHENYNGWKWSFLGLYTFTTQQTWIPAIFFKQMISKHQCQLSEPKHIFDTINKVIKTTYKLWPGKISRTQLWSLCPRSHASLYLVTKIIKSRVKRQEIKVTR